MSVLQPFQARLGNSNYLGLDVFESELGQLLNNVELRPQIGVPLRLELVHQPLREHPRIAP
eukprot:CAMPEP_0176127468 /NCGR_PEP_ID=MMETSP0120_2-20121206/64378_1 /TAXON_ID=160619 /ORGANISM="Kryptoperidinium foliaceum, Strain CCMP 1326" /LENGTH=60 /DNA_ID=CAMNT_0017462489 /DNA_START=11 /DNA_END=191 /DNA_ORIENTATION=-